MVRSLSRTAVVLAIMAGPQAVAQMPPAVPAQAPIPVAAPKPARTTPLNPDGTPMAIDATLKFPPETLTPAEIARMQALLADYAQLARYRAANAALPAAEPGRVVFFGDSITDGWHIASGADPSFPGKPYVNRGISGQTTSQMLLRFRPDVIALKPAAVVILAGTNDLAGNTGLVTMQSIQDNLQSMADLATAHGIKVIFSSVLPVDDYPWRRGLHPADKVRALNAWMQQTCADHGYTYLDYYTALATPEGAMKPGTSRDGVHPTAAGYAIMAPLAQAAIDRAINAR